MNRSPNPQIVPDSAWDRRVPSDQPRPVPEAVTILCDRCGENEVTIVLEWWCPIDAPFNGKWWIIETVDNFHRLAKMCDSCTEKRLEALERAREYESDVPPSWFDPLYAGERWSEED